MNEAQIEFHKVSHTDLKELENISRLTFTESFSEVNDPDNFANYLDNNFSSEVLTKEINNPNSAFYLVKFGGESVAYFKTNIGKAQTEPNHDDGLEVERIYVTKSYHRQGFGQRMLEKAETLARSLGKKYIWLGVWKENPEAIQFYQKMGFSKIGVHVFQLGNEAQVDYMMAKDL